MTLGTAASAYRDAIEKLRGASQGQYCGPAVSVEALNKAVEATKGLDTEKIRAAACEASGESEAKPAKGLWEKGKEFFGDIASGKIFEKIVDGVKWWYGVEDSTKEASEATDRACTAIEQTVCDAEQGITKILEQVKDIIDKVVAQMAHVDKCKHPEVFTQCVRSGAEIIDSSAKMILGLCKDRDEAIHCCFDRLIDHCKQVCEEPKPKEAPKCEKPQCPPTKPADVCGDGGGTGEKPAPEKPTTPAPTPAPAPAAPSCPAATPSEPAAVASPKPDDLLNPAPSTVLRPEMSLDELKNGLNLDDGSSTQEFNIAELLPKLAIGGAVAVGAVGCGFAVAGGTLLLKFIEDHVGGDGMFPHPPAPEVPPELPSQDVSEQSVAASEAAAPPSEPAATPPPEPTPPPAPEPTSTSTSAPESVSQPVSEPQPAPEPAPVVNECVLNEPPRQEATPVMRKLGGWNS